MFVFEDPRYPIGTQLENSGLKITTANPFSGNKLKAVQFLFGNFVERNRGCAASILIPHMFREQRSTTEEISLWFTTWGGDALRDALIDFPSSE